MEKRRHGFLWCILRHTLRHCRKYRFLQKGPQPRENQLGGRFIHGKEGIQECLFYLRIRTLQECEIRDDFILVGIPEIGEKKRLEEVTSNGHMDGNRVDIGYVSLIP